MTDQCVLPDWVKPGVTFRLEFKHGKKHNLRRVRAIVDGNAVTRYWTDPSRGWVYEVQDPEWFETYKKHIKVVKHAKA